MYYLKRLSETACSSQFHVHWAGPYFPWGMQRFWGPFVFSKLFAFREIFVNHWACPFAARFTLKTALNSHEECNEFADLLFQRPSLWIILPSERLFNFSRAARSLSLYFYTSYTFLPILELFTHFSYTNLSDVYYRAECFYYPWLCRWSAKARSLILIFSFISQRPHLNYILLSNIYSFEFP